MGTDTTPTWNISEFTAGLRERAQASGYDVIDLGQGAPTEPTPEVARRALARGADAPGYPRTQGTAELSASYAAWARRRLGADVPANAVLPTIGSKEFIAGLPTWLGLACESTVVIPNLAYPTYAYGAQRVGASVQRADSVVALGPTRPDLLWLNTPSNPTGAVLPVEHLRKVVEWGRSRGCPVVSDECYLELGAPGQPVVSVLSPEVNGGDLSGLLAVHSLSKRSAMAGYRIGFVAGDPGLVTDLLRQRRDSGLILPGPMQAVAAAVLDDDTHVDRARRLYAERRACFSAALQAAGFEVPADQAGLFVWTTRHQSDMATVEQLADVGIVAAPGGFYGPSGGQHVRFALTVGGELLADLIDRLRLLA